MKPGNAPSSRYRQKKDSRDLLTECMFVLVVSTAFLAVLCIGNARRAGERSLTTTTITVQQGDTLWDLSREHCPSWMDRRDWIARVAKENRTRSMLEVGQRLTIIVEGERHEGNEENTGRQRVRGSSTAVHE